MSTTKRIIVGFLLISIFSLMSLVIYKVDKNRVKEINDCEETRQEYRQNLRILDSLSNEIKIKETVIKLKKAELEITKKEVEGLRKEKEFLTALPREEDIKKIKFNR